MFTLFAAIGLSRTLFHGADLKITVADLLLGTTAFSITLAVGLQNLHEEKVDQRLRLHRCQVIRRSSNPIISDLLGYRFNNPITELEYCAIETSPIGIFSATLDTQLKNEIRQLKNLETIWAYPDADNCSPPDIESLKTEFPDLQFESTNQQERFPLTPLLPTFKWYHYLKLFPLSFLLLILVKAGIIKKNTISSENFVE